MKGRQSFLWLAAVAVALSIVILQGCSSKTKAQKNSKADTLETPNDAGASLPRMLDLGSTTCIPCKRMAPIIDSLENAYAGIAEIRFIDVREDKESARKFGITMIPTQIFFDNAGNEVYRHIGFFPADSIVAHFKALGANL